MALFDHLKPSNFGAKSAADTGIFILGAAIGGIADSVLNFAGFAEPLVIAGFTGAAALSAKQLIWDATILPRLQPSERSKVLEEIAVEIALLNRAAPKDRERRDEFLATLRESGLDADAIRRLWLENR
jgi:hypothetical protein